MKTKTNVNLTNTFSLYCNGHFSFSAQHFFLFLMVTKPTAALRNGDVEGSQTGPCVCRKTGGIMILGGCDDRSVFYVRAKQLDYVLWSKKIPSFPQRPWEIGRAHV